MKKADPVIIPLQSLDDCPGPYTMSFGYDPELMIESVRRVGLIHPPFVDRDEEGRVRIVTGYRRILALKTLGEREVRCMDLSGSGIPTAEKLLIALYDNVSSRVFNGAEKGMVLKRLTDHFGEDEVVRRYMPLLGLPAHRPTLHTYIQVNELEEDIRVGFARDRLSLRTMRSLLEMDTASRTACVEWLHKLILNFNQQSQFIEFLVEISLSENETISDFLSEGALPALLRDVGLNGPQKVKAVLDFLRRRRMPRLFQAEKDFEEITHDLRLPEGVGLRHAPYFEGPDYQLEIRFRNGKDLKEKVLTLAGNERLADIDSPWKAPRK